MAIAIAIDIPINCNLFCFNKSEIVTIEKKSHVIKTKKERFFIKVEIIPAI